MKFIIPVNNHCVLIIQTINCQKAFVSNHTYYTWQPSEQKLITPYILHVFNQNIPDLFTLFFTLHVTEAARVKRW